MLANSDIVRQKALKPDHESVAATARWDEANEIHNLVERRIAILRNELARKEVDVPPTSADLYTPHGKVENGS